MRLTHPPSWAADFVEVPRCASRPMFILGGGRERPEPNAYEHGSKGYYRAPTTTSEKNGSAGS